MAFKRIHGITNEWEVSVYSSQAQKTLTFARIFTNVETAEAYQNLFEDLFSCIERGIGESFNFHHIHKKGLGCIIADQHKGQALGLGQYLNSKYPHLTSIEHLQHIYKLCQEDILEVLNKIQVCNELGAASKLHLFSLISLNFYAFTKMDCTIWNQTSNNTNASESAHANVNRDGCNLSLLAGVIRGQEFDKRQWESANVHEQYNVPESYRNKSELACSIQAEKRAEKRRKKQSSTSTSSRIVKKQKGNGHNKENAIDIGEENSYLEQQKKKK
ncbi:hypothetical protein C1646_776683 [Rhizophagus diaphanus]|nr:hypothetical protein C1646_776683 [Rhizophagus diaphanus] [Rhizophagus sp. MUCL 43196]